jgi:hypothetical protein
MEVIFPVCSLPRPSTISRLYAEPSSCQLACSVGCGSFVGAVRQAAGRPPAEGRATARRGQGDRQGRPYPLRGVSWPWRVGATLVVARGFSPCRPSGSPHARRVHPITISDAGLPAAKRRARRSRASRSSCVKRCLSGIWLIFPSSYCFCASSCAVKGPFFCVEGCRRWIISCRSCSGSVPLLAAAAASAAYS